MRGYKGIILGNLEIAMSEPQSGPPVFHVSIRQIGGEDSIELDAEDAKRIKDFLEWSLDRIEGNNHPSPIIPQL